MSPVTQGSGSKRHVYHILSADHLKSMNNINTVVFTRIILMHGRTYSTMPIRSFSGLHIILCTHIRELLHMFVVGHPTQLSFAISHKDQLSSLGSLQGKEHTYMLMKKKPHPFPVDTGKG